MKLLVIIAAAIVSAGLSSAVQRTDAELETMSSRGFSMHSNDSAGQGSTLVDDGNGCTIMSTPSGSISTGC